MPIFAPPTLNRYSQTNLTGASRTGATVTADVSAHTLGTYASLIDPTTKPSYGAYLTVTSLETAVTDTSALLNLAYEDSGGGGTRVIVVENLDIGEAAGGNGNGGKQYFLPVYIPSGVRVCAAIQAVIGGETATVSIWLAQDPLNAPNVGVCTTYGADTANSRGTSVTGAAADFGSWTQIGTADTDPAKRHRYWSAGFDSLGDTTIGSTETLLEIGIGPDASNVTAIGQFRFYQHSAERISGPFPNLVYAEVPIAGELWARHAGEAEARGVVIHGFD